MDREMFILFYKSMVRPHIEHANSVWNPFKKGDIEGLEKLQKRATKLVVLLKHLYYKDRLYHLHLSTLKYRHLQGDKIEVYKLTRNYYDQDVVVKVTVECRGFNKRQ